MGVKLKGNWKPGPQRAKAAGERLAQCMFSAMSDAMEFANEVGVDVIDSSGTEKSWLRPSSSGRSGSFGGRVDSGAMRDDFNAVALDEGDKIIGIFGWPEGSPFYYELQEGGFKHWITGEMIQGMHALREADEEAWAEFQKNSEKCIKEYVNAL